MTVPRQIALLQGARFTSAQPRQGWRHFHVVGLLRTPEGWAAELAASCDPTRRVVVAVRALKSAEWAHGWVPLSAAP
ncbi:MAG: TIGR02450 family Trp-rich protein [Myxococcus sp.]|nr:TIGR02450 family Trp-rich protein [Myxococcus sp.]